MEEPTTKQGQNVHIQIKNEASQENELNEDDTIVDFLPKINLEEPEPDDDIVKWAERNIKETPSNKVELIEELRDMIFGSTIKKHKTINSAKSPAPPSFYFQINSELLEDYPSEMLTRFANYSKKKFLWF